MRGTCWHARSAWQPSMGKAWKWCTGWWGRARSSSPGCGIMTRYGSWGLWGTGSRCRRQGSGASLSAAAWGFLPFWSFPKGFRERRRFSWAMRMPRSWTGISGDMAGRSMWRARPGMAAFAGRCWSLWRPSRLWRIGYMPVVPGRCCRPWQNGQKGRASRFRYPWRNGWPAA